MDNPLMFQMVGVMLTLFVCFLTYMNTKVWRATHVTFAFLVFAAGLAFVIYASLTLKTHKVWKAYAQQKEKELELEVKKREELTDGKLDEFPPTTPNITNLTMEVSRSVIGRGRVWRGCSLAAAPDANGGVTLSTAPLAPPGVDPATLPPPKPNNMQPRTVVHAFKESPANDPAIQIKLPAVYLGIFEATATTETNVTLAPLLPLDTEQRGEAQDGSATWTLYETMPTDNHEVFAGLAEDQLRLLFPMDRTGLLDEDYNRLIKSYTRTGGAFDAADRPEEKWLKVKFLEPHKVQVNSDGPGAALMDGGAFDAEGRAIVPSLRRIDGDVEFKPGAVAIFFSDDDATRQLVSERKCEVVEELYRRPLNDYAYVFHHRFSRFEEIKTRLKEIARDIDSLKRSDAEIQKQIAIKTDEKAKLLADQRAVKYELTSVQKYRGDLEQQLAAVRTQCNELYRTNKKLAQDLSELNAKMTEEINAKTRAATASTN